MLSLKCVCVRARTLNTLLVGSECNLEWPNRKWSCRQTELRITNHDSCLLPQGDIQVYLARCVHVCVKFTQRLFLFRNKVLQVPTLHLFSRFLFNSLVKQLSKPFVVPSTYKNWEKWEVHQQARGQ